MITLVNHNRKVKITSTSRCNVSINPMLSEIFPIRDKTSSKDETHWDSTPLYLRSCQKGNNQCRALPYEGYACGSHDEGIGLWKARKIVGVDGSWIVWINHSAITSSGYFQIGNDWHGVTKWECRITAPPCKDGCGLCDMNYPIWIMQNEWGAGEWWSRPFWLKNVIYLRI